MTPSDLKSEHEAAFPYSLFFSRVNMRAAGDTMKNYGVRKECVQEQITGKWFDVWELYRKKPVNYLVQLSAFFDRETFKRVYV